MNWLEYFVPFGTAGGGAASVYGLVVRPRQKDHERNEAERKEQRRQSNGFMYGVKPIEGVTVGALSAPVRLHAVETSMVKVVLSVEELSVMVNESNGTVKRIENMVADIKPQVAAIAGKPPASVADVVQAFASEHEANEGRQVEILSALKKDTTALVKDIKPDGGNSSRDVLDEQSRVLHDIADEQDRVKEERSKDDEGA